MRWTCSLQLLCVVCCRATSGVLLSQHQNSGTFEEVVLGMHHQSLLLNGTNQFTLRYFTRQGTAPAGQSTRRVHYANGSALHSGCLCLRTMHSHALLPGHR